MIPTIEEMKEIHNKRRSRGRRQQDMNNILRLVPRSLNFSISAVEEAEQLLVKTKAGEITTFALVALGAGTVISAAVAVPDAYRLAIKGALMELANSI